MATLEAPSVVGLAEVEKRGRRAETLFHTHTPLSHTHTHTSASLTHTPMTTLPSLSFSLSLLNLY